MTTLTDQDDIGPDYLAYREVASAEGAIARARQRTRAPEDEMRPVPSGPEAKPQGDDAGFGKRALSMVKSVAADVGLGAVEAPRQAIGGISDFVHNVFSAGDSLANWMNENVADLRVQVPKTGIEPLDELIENPARAIAGPGKQRKVTHTPEGRPIVQNPDGSVSTERTMTITDPRINNGKPTNIPTLYGGKEVSEDEAIEIIAKNKGIDPDTNSVLPAFDSITDATTAAKKRSKELGDWIAAQTQPEVPAARTTTGGFVREASRFLTGFKMVGTKLAGEKLAGIPAGSISDFVGQDPDAKRLADLWNQAGLPANVLTDWLASDPTDSEAEKRFKNAVEGGVFGTLVEGVKHGARYIRSKFQAARAGAQQGVQAIDDAMAGPRVTDRDFMILGDPNAPLLKVTGEPEHLATSRRSGKLTVAMEATDTGVPAAVAAKGVTADAATEPAIMINFARINEPDDVKKVIQNMADAFSPAIEKARRGRITNDQTKALADDLGMDVADLLQRRKGQPFNAEEALAARQLWASSAEKLLEAARRAAEPNAGSVDQFNFRKLMATHYAIQAEVIGARTETARALQSWRIPAGGNVEKARAIESLIDGMGGPDVSAAMAQRLALLAQSNVPADAISMFTRKSAFATTMDAVKEAWINALLSSPKTHIVNTASNSLTTVMQVYERGIAARLGELAGRAPGQGVAPGEDAAMLYGLISGWKDAFRAAAKTARTGESEMGTTLGKIDLPGRYSRGAQGAVSARALGVNEAGAAGQAVDFIGNALRIPTRMLATVDEFFKSIAYRMEVHAQAFRQAFGEGLQGTKLGERVAQIVSDPPESVRIAAADHALYSTFTNKPGWFGQGVMNLRAKGDAWNPITFILPFVRTPVNIARFAFERSILAPAVGQWRADLAAGGARADLATARMATGTAIMFLTADMAMSGQITGRGPKDAGEREALQRQGQQPYSIKVGNKWVSYNRTDPFGMTLGFAADFTEAMSRGEVDPDDVDEWNEVMAGMIASVSQVAVSKTYLQGMSDFFEAMSDPTRYSRNYIDRLVSSFVPSGVNVVKQFVDPVTREASDPYEAIIAKLPGLSERLIPARDLWGTEKKPESGMGRAYDVLSPVQVREAKDSPIDHEMARLTMDLRRIAKKTSFDGVDVNFRDFPQVYDAYVRLAGNEFKHPAWGMGAKDFLDAVVTGKHDLSEVYRLKTDGKDGTKADWIRGQVLEFRRLAQRAILDDPQFAAFRAYVDDRKTERRDKRAPANLQGGVTLQ